MELATLAIPFFLLGVAVIVLWATIHTRRDWRIKLALIVMVPLSVLAVWASMDSYLGWPTGDTLPDRFIIISGVIQEPDGHGNPGAIYLWVRSTQPVRHGLGLLQYSADSGEPRAYRLPYSRKLHEQVAGGLEKMKSGVPMVGRRMDQRSYHEEINLYELPPPHLTDKR